MAWNETAREKYKRSSDRYESEDSIATDLKISAPKSGSAVAF